ncbi:MAG: DUF2934 domain-containing protein [Nitrospira sp.]
MNVEPSHQMKKTKRRTSTSTPTRTVTPPVAHTGKAVSSNEDLHVLTAKRAYELYSERGYRHGYALNDWLDAEREILSQIPPV